MITNNNISSNRSLSTNDNSNRSRLLKKNKSFNSEYRSETIPSKGNLGYDMDQNGNRKMIINNKDAEKINGNKNDSVGPGQYNIESKWEKNFISWEKMRNDNDEKYNAIKARKNLSPLTQLEKEYLTNLQRHPISKARTENNSLYNAKTKIFNYFMNNRYDKARNVNEKKESNDFLLEGMPGPGYYSPEANYPEIYEYNKYKKNYYPKSPRFKTVSKANNDLGPGYYYNKSKPKKVQKPKYILGLFDHLNKKDNLCALKLSLTKENYEIPGPEATISKVISSMKTYQITKILARMTEDSNKA